MKNKFGRRTFLDISSGGLISSVENSRENIHSLKQDKNKNLRLGFIGIGGRGFYHLTCALGIEGVEVPAISEIKPVRLYQAKRAIEEAGLPSPTLYNKADDYLKMCEKEDLDAIICSTSWEYHTPICVAAMKNNKHAVTEVPICITLDEAWELIETHESTGKWATLGLEGFYHMEILNLIRHGLLGDIVHAETGYIHDLRMVKFTPNEEPWRLQHSIDRNGNLYPDHPMASMLPMLDINHGDRFEYIQSMSSSSVMLRDYAELNYGKKSPFANTKYSLGDYNVSLARTVKGKMMTIIHDTSTPHPREHIRVQGTKGVYYSHDGYYTHDIYLEGLSPQKDTWESADKYFEQYPLIKEEIPPRKGGTIRGHGSGGNKTPLVWHRLIRALRENKITDWDVYDSVTSSAIVQLSCDSVANKSKAIDFPDFTRGKWKSKAPIMPFA